MMDSFINCATTANNIVHGQRRQDYGHPYDDYDRVAKMWSAILGVSVTPRQAALCMICIKLSREVHAHKEDNLVDICGYALVTEMIVERERQIADDIEDIVKKIGEAGDSQDTASLTVPCCGEWVADPPVVDNTRTPIPGE